MDFSHIVAILGACIAKLASSADDVVWLLPFVSGMQARRKWTSIGLYIATLECVVLLSWIIAAAGGEVLKLWLPGTDVGRLLEFVSVFLLAAYAVVLWRREHGADHSQSRTRGSLVVIAFLGSLDELSYFPGLQWSGLFNAWQLAAGTALAGLAVAGICLGAGRLRGLMRRIEKIPLWMIVAFFMLLSFIGAVG